MFGLVFLVQLWVSDIPRSSPSPSPAILILISFLAINFALVCLILWPIYFDPNYSSSSKSFSTLMSLPMIRS